MKYALIDMGSNSIRLTVYDIDQLNFKILFKGKVMAGLAGYVKDGALTPDGIDCACQALLQFQHTLKLLQIHNLAVFATASLRNISNTDQAVRKIRLVTGIQVEVLSGELEAEYGFSGACSDVAIRDGLFADIGGASTELVLSKDSTIQNAYSIPVGSLKLYRNCVKKILPGKEAQRQIRETILQTFDNSGATHIPAQEHMVCVGGTARAALRLCRKLYDLPDHCRCFSHEQLTALATYLCKGDKKSTDLILRYEPERIHTLIPGILILSYLADRYKVKDITVSHYGVREGYLHQKIQTTLTDSTELP